MSVFNRVLKAAFLIGVILGVYLTFGYQWAINTVVRVRGWGVSDWINFGTRLMATSSVLHTFLPPWDWEPEFITVGLSDFPGAQKWFRTFFHNRWYKAMIYFIGFVAVNIRSTVWHYISTKNADGPNANMPTNTMTVASAVIETKQVNVNPVPGE